MKSSKKPDNVAWDEENEEYIAKLTKILEKPYQIQKDMIDYQSVAPLKNQKYQTFCGT